MKNALRWIARKFGYQIRREQPLRHLLFDEAAEPDYEALKSFANRAARFSAAAGETEAVRNLYLTGLLREQPHSETSRIEIGDAQTLKIGIWKKNAAKDNEFVRRSDRSHEWFYWADRETIGSKRHRWRVVLLGESVARGYLYDPHFNPASALEQMLRSTLGAGAIEVVDLAKSNQTIQELKIIAGECLALDPDLVVIFAGNNWRPHLTESNIPYVASLLRAEGVPAMKAFLDERQEESVRQTIGQVASILGKRAVRAIWIVPEFNLADWSDPECNAPHLRGQGNSQWQALGEDAGRALQVRDFARAGQLAKKMMELDGGTNSLPPRILADCCGSRDDHPGRRRYLEMCRDAEGWNPSFSYSPRVSSIVQRVLREAGSVAGNSVVDLSDVLSRHLDGALPDRRVFLDYCHLSAEGISVAMAAVASRIVELLTGKTLSPESLQRTSALPAPKVEGKASLLAAVHNAHFYQGPDIVRHWCERALSFWPEAADVMLRFADFQTRRAPQIACGSAIELILCDELDTCRYLMRGGRHHIDIALVGTIESCVKAAGRAAGTDFSALRVQEHSPRSGPKELTDLYYCSAIPGRSEPAWTSQSFLSNRGSHSIYASAFWRQSKFIFFAERGQSLGLRFTYRIPHTVQPGGSVEIAINGRRVAQAAADHSWRTFSMPIPRDCFVHGQNEITIGWPDREDCCDDELDRAASALAARQLPFFYRIYGEIHSLLVFDPEISAESHRRGSGVLPPVQSMAPG
jgi:hypothetical protein